MAKASAPGRTKTRLSPPLSLAQAAQLNTAFLTDIADNLAAAARTANLAGYMAFGPPDAAPFFHALMPEDIGLIEAWLPNFGDCLLYTAESLLQLGYGAACVLNSDSPTLPTSLLIDAAHALQRPGDRLVIGPSTDGGYYFLGLKQPHRRVFEDIEWSTAGVMSQTLARAAELDLDVVQLPAWYDVDDAAGLGVLMREIQGSSFSSQLTSYVPRHSMRLLRGELYSAAMSA